MQTFEGLAFSAYPYLLITTSIGVTKVPLINQGSWLAGRGTDNDIHLYGKSTSRHHAMLQVIGRDDFLLIDLGSSNGTFVNSRRVVMPVSLKNGDRITIGDNFFHYFNFKDKANHIQESTTSKLDTDIVHVRRLITVLVVDIRNFTQLTLQLDEKILSQLIGMWVRRAGEIISRYGSWVDKYMGDAVMSVWIHNLTDQVEENDITVGREMLQTFSALRELFIMTNCLNEEFELPFTLRVGAGVNTGEAMVGKIGTANHSDYTALGDTVNAAFRLESITKEINLDIALGQKTWQKTYQCIPNAQLPFKQHFVKLKGYDKPITTYAGNLADLENFLDNITL